MRSVLLVEPHDDTRELYAAYFQFEGVTIQTASSGDEALPMARSVDVVVTELLMAGVLDGPAFIRAVRGDAALRRLPIVVLSAVGTPDAISGAFGAGCDLFLTKPCLPDQLLRAIRDVRRPRTARAVDTTPYAGPADRRDAAILRRKR